MKPLRSLAVDRYEKTHVKLLRIA